MFNRDLTILVIQEYINLLKEESNLLFIHLITKSLKGKDKFEDIVILDALTASGLRPIRYLKELGNIKLVYANDISSAAHEMMQENFKINDIDQSKIKS